LVSCKDIADEIILVYNDSCDRTVEIAKSYGVNCFENDFVCYRDQKTFAFQLCTNEWTLSLDSDECISSELYHSLKSFLNSSQLKSFSGCSFNRKSFFLGRWIKHGDWYPDVKIRVSRKSLSSWGGLPEHDILQIDGPVCHLDGDLLHYSYRDINHLISKSLSFSDLFLKRSTNVQIIDDKSLAEILFRSSFKFFRAYFFKLGFLDGYQGLLIALNSSFFTLIKYFKLKFHQQ
jgi:hypothetical protein